MNKTADEGLPEPSNPLGINGIEFIEFTTAQPLALGELLQRFGFSACARHRSREVMLYRHGPMNLIVNAHPDAVAAYDAASLPAISAIALRVRDAAFAYRHVVELGAWEIPTHAQAMELNIPCIRGAGNSQIHFVDRYQEFSIYDVDFIPLEGGAKQPAASAGLEGLHFFGVVQAVQRDRSADWIDFYRVLFGFDVLDDNRFVGILHKGSLLQSPCRSFEIQLVEPPEGADEVVWDEGLIRIGFGTPDVIRTQRALEKNGVVFVDRAPLQPSEKGAITQPYFGQLTFELVVSEGAGGSKARAARAKSRSGG